MKGLQDRRYQKEQVEQQIRNGRLAGLLTDYPNLWRYHWRYGLLRQSFLELVVEIFPKLTENQQNTVLDALLTLQDQLPSEQRRQFDSQCSRIAMVTQPSSKKTLYVRLEERRTEDALGNLARQPQASSNPAAKLTFSRGQYTEFVRYLAGELSTRQFATQNAIGNTPATVKKLRKLIKRQLSARGLAYSAFALLDSANKQSWQPDRLKETNDFYIEMCRNAEIVCGPLARLSNKPVELKEGAYSDLLDYLEFQLNLRGTTLVTYSLFSNSPASVRKLYQYITNNRTKISDQSLAQQALLNLEGMVDPALKPYNRDDATHKFYEELFKAAKTVCGEPHDFLFRQEITAEESDPGVAAYTEASGQRVTLPAPKFGEYQEFLSRFQKNIFTPVKAVYESYDFPNTKLLNAVIEELEELFTTAPRQSSNLGFVFTDPKSVAEQTLLILNMLGLEPPTGIRALYLLTNMLKASYKRLKIVADDFILDPFLSDNATNGLQKEDYVRFINGLATQLDRQKFIIGGQNNWFPGIPATVSQLKTAVQKHRTAASLDHRSFIEEQILVILQRAINWRDSDRANATQAFYNKMYNYALKVCGYANQDEFQRVRDRKFIAEIDAYATERGTDPREYTGVGDKLTGVKRADRLEQVKILKAFINSSNHSEPQRSPSLTVTISNVSEGDPRNINCRAMHGLENYTHLFASGNSRLNAIFERWLEGTTSSNVKTWSSAKCQTPMENVPHMHAHMLF